MSTSITQITTYTVPPDVKSLNVTEKERAGYVIMNYDDKMVCNNDQELGKYRSVVYDGKKTRLMSYSPPKSIEFETFMQRIPTLDFGRVQISEIIEGTMMTLFYDAERREWELATKGAIGANYWFYRTQYEADPDTKQTQLTFRQMFLEAIAATGLTGSLFEGLPQDCCYTFVMQHPKNHIVVPIDRPQLFLVAVHRLEGAEFKATALNVYDPELQQRIPGFQSGIMRVPCYYEEETTYDAYKEKYCTIHNGNPHMVGLMFLDLKTGDRAHLENPAYSELRELRGNHPNLQYQYLCLMRMKRVPDFLYYFPQYRGIFWRFFDQWKNFVTATHQSYVSYYVKKTEQRISRRFFPLVYKIHHEVYLPALNAGTRQIMKRPAVQAFLEGLEPAELIYYLNYPKHADTVSNAEQSPGNA